jgi:hypothetical protein
MSESRLLIVAVLFGGLTGAAFIVTDVYRRSTVSTELPEVHVPAKLQGKQLDRKRKKPCYSCAYETKWAGDQPKSTYAVWGGPWDDLTTALDSVPPDNTLKDKMQTKDACIVRHLPDGREETIYRWDQPRSEKTGYPEGPGRWVRAAGVK